MSMEQEETWVSESVVPRLRARLLQGAKIAIDRALATPESPDMPALLQAGATAFAAATAGGIDAKTARTFAAAHEAKGPPNAAD